MRGLLSTGQVLSTHSAQQSLWFVNQNKLSYYLYMDAMLHTRAHSMIVGVHHSSPLVLHPRKHDARGEHGALNTMHAVNMAP
jgi:hypothetical protein